jgi:hypothetical protein
MNKARRRLPSSRSPFGNSLKSNCRRAWNKARKNILHPSCLLQIAGARHYANKPEGEVFHYTFTCRSAKFADTTYFSSQFWCTTIQELLGQQMHMDVHHFKCSKNKHKQQLLIARKRKVSTERPPLFGEVSVKLWR